MADRLSRCRFSSASEEGSAPDHAELASQLRAPRRSPAINDILEVSSNHHCLADPRSRWATSSELRSSSAALGWWGLADLADRNPAAIRQRRRLRDTVE
jgi:hypothetical protein